MNRIKELRQKNNLTLKQLGKKLDMLDSTLSQYETGKRNPKDDVWKKIAKFFGVSVPYLKGLTFSKYDIYKILNDEYLSNSNIELTTKVNRYLAYANVKPPQELFNNAELLNFDKKVQEYWENNFSFIFDSRIVSMLLSMEKRSDYLLPVDERLTGVIETKTLAITETPISKAFDDIADNRDYSLIELITDYENITRFVPKKYINKYIDNSIKELKELKKALKDLPDNKQEYKNV